MTVKEVEALLPITRANIRFYEKEGLFTPGRMENGYRDYSEEDIKSLKEIILFRKLGISLPDIKRIMAGEMAVSEAVKVSAESLQEQLQELQGAIGLCHQMLADKSLDTEFAVDEYWQAMEEKEMAGSRFASYLHDYVEFESKSFLLMWDKVFFIRLYETVTQKGWRITLCIVLGICVLRGLARHFLWHVDSFWGGFSYPLVLFGLETLIVLPIYILNTLYQEKEMAARQRMGRDAGEGTGEISRQAVKTEASKKGTDAKQWKDRHPGWWGLFQALVFVLGFILIIYGPLVLGGVVVESITGIHENYIIAQDLYVLFFMVAISFLIVLYWLNSKMGILGKRLTGEKGYVCCLPRRERYLVAAVSFLIYILVNVVCIGWYGCAYEDGLQITHMYVAKDYSWDEIDHVALREDGHGVLQYIVFTKDGKKMDLMGGAVSVSSFDESRYPELEEDFVLELTGRFVKQGVPFDVNWKKLKKKLGYDYWKEYMEELHVLVGEDVAPSK